METAFQSHPLPQNVTNFEFHLIGDMTLKQFGYLASGVGFAYLVFVLAAAQAPLLAWPIIVVSSLTGIAFAFLPIYERPLDHWVGAFFKAIFKPTKMEYKSAIITKEDPLFKNRLNIYLKNLKNQEILLSNNLASISPSLTDKIASKVDVAPPGEAKIAVPVVQTQSIPPGPSLQAVPQPKPDNIPPHLNSAAAVHPEQPGGLLSKPDILVVKEEPKQPTVLEGDELKKTVELAKEAQETQAKIKQIEVEIENLKAKAATPGEDPREYLDNFQKLLTSLQSLNNEAGNLARQMTAVSSKGSQTQASSLQQPNTPPVKAKNIPTLTLTTFQNVINGIVTDSEGNYIENAIIVAHDKQGLPVRALKSNKLGQFIAATPLPNGVYTVVVEKEGAMFDVVEIELKGEVMKPVIVSARKPVYS